MKNLWKLITSFYPITLGILISVVILTIFFVSGCQEQQTNEPKVWGQGDLPSQWTDFFGNGNLSRFNFVQTQSINRTGQALAELVERVRKLEAVQDPNNIKVKDAGDN